MSRGQTRSEARRLLTLAWPITLTNLQWILLNLIDTALVGHASTRELGHLSAGRAITYVAVVMAIAMLSGILVFAARADGAGERARCGDVLRQGLLFAAALGTAACLILIPGADWLVRVAGTPEELREGGAFYIRMMALAYPPQFLFLAASYFMEGISRPRVAMWINIATLPLNALFAWVLIGGRFGLPALGAGGAALGTALAVSVAAAALFVYIGRMPNAAEFGIRGLTGPVVARWRRAWGEGAALRGFAVAPGVSAGLELTGFSILIALSTGFGAATAGAFQAAVAYHNLSLAFSLGVGSAAGVRVGNAVGAGDWGEIARRGWIAAGLAFAVAIVLAVLFRLGAPILVPVISDDPAVVALGIDMLRRLALWLPFDGVQLVFLFALRALGDQVMSGVISIACFFVLMGGLGWWLVERTGAGPMALVDALIVGFVAAMLLMGGRFGGRARRAARRGRI